MGLKSWLRGLFVTVAPAKAAEEVSSYSRGFLVDEGLAMKTAAVYSAVKLISESVAMLPFELLRYNSSRRFWVPFYESSLFEVLRTVPNGRMTAFVFWREAMRHILLRGNAYIIPRRDAMGEVTGLVLCAPGTVQHDVVRDVYVVNDLLNGLNGVFSSEDVVHLRNIGVDGGFVGKSVLEVAAEALRIGAYADDLSGRTLANGGLIRGFVSGQGGGVLPTMGAANAKQTGDVTDRIERELAGGKQILSMPSDMKFQPLALSPQDLKLLESKQMSIRDIARFFRVHPELLYEGTNNTYKSSEVPNVMFLHQTLAPLLTQIEQEVLVKLVPKEVRRYCRLHFDRELLYLTDLSTEVSYIKGTLEAGVYTVNDWRAKKGLPALPNGDVALVSANLKALDELAQPVQG